MTQKIKGYRDLSQEELDLINEIKQVGMQLSSLVNKVQMKIIADYNAASLRNDVHEIERLDSAEPTEWCAEAKRDLQVGLMKLTRSVAQPGSTGSF